MKTIKIGILGLGTVGSGVVRMITDYADKISTNVGGQIKIKTILIHNPKKKRNVDLTGIKVTTDIDEIINDPEIQMVVEVMGTIERAKDYITRALLAHKNVITANKDLLALHGPELVALARKQQCNLYYEASVAGGIPILRTIVNSFSADKIVEVKGIVNGTTNYILTQMSQNNLDYNTALKQAQELGFAEADPTNDVQGIDAVYKMVILTQFAFGQNISVEDIEREGITKIDIADITGAKRLGYQIKLLGRAKLFNGHIAISVSPTLIPQNQVLANIQNENNAVFVTGASVGETMFYGPGAGELPTANSVLSDIISVGKNILANRIGNSFNSYQAHVPLADSSEIIDPYYLSLEVDDVPGQLLKITEIMNNANASFNVLIQDELPDNRARIMMITHSMSKSQLTEVKNNLSNVNNLNIKAAFRVLK